VSRSTVVLCHGAWHGAWCWEHVVPLLEQRGIDVRTLTLPSIDAPPGDTGGLAGDAAAVGRVLDDVGGTALLVGHSYGGMVVTAASAGRDDISRLFYLAAFMPDEGESLFALTGGEPAPWIREQADGRVLPDLELASSVFYADCDPLVQEAAIERLKPMPPKSFVDLAAAAGWHSIPSTYVVCAQDGALPPELQRDLFAPRATERIELEASHSPFYSQPAALAELIAARAG
jgi:pimeloyl-ACP methyl ester carboxylesterase